MYIQTQQPKPRCSKCGSLSFHEYQNESIDFNEMIKTIEYHIQCNICKHEAILNTIRSTHSDKPIIYNMKSIQQPEFKYF